MESSANPENVDFYNIEEKVAAWKAYFIVTRWVFICPAKELGNLI